MKEEKVKFVIDETVDEAAPKSKETRDGWWEHKVGGGKK